METFKLSYDEQFAGAKAVAQQNGAQATTGWYNSALVESYAPGAYAYLTGYYYLTYEGIYLQTTYGLYLYNDLDNPAWAAGNERISVPYKTQTQAQALVRKIINNNIAITQNNLVCARYASKFTKEQQQLIRELQQRVQQRSEALKENGFCTDIETNYPAGYVDLEPYLTALMQGEAIGIATWAVIVIAATVLTATATAAYFAYRYFADQSDKDVKYSKELTAILAQKLTPEEYQQLLDETKGIVTKARIKQAAGSYWNAIRIAALGAAAYIGYKLFKNRQTA